MTKFSADGAVGASPFPPIADYGFLSDYYAALCVRLESGLLVGRRRANKFERA